MLQWGKRIELVWAPWGSRLGKVADLCRVFHANSLPLPVWCWTPIWWVEVLSSWLGWASPVMELYLFEYVPDSKILSVVPSLSYGKTFPSLGPMKSMKIQTVPISPYLKNFKGGKSPFMFYYVQAFWFPILTCKGHPHHSLLSQSSLLSLPWTVAHCSFHKAFILHALKCCKIFRQLFLYNFSMLKL